MTPSAFADAVAGGITGWITGQVEQMVVAGATDIHATDSVHYFQGTNQAELTVPLTDGQEMTFGGRSESRPAARRYQLDVTFVRIPEYPPKRFAKNVNVTGTCSAVTSPDAAVWRRIKCHAKDETGAKYDLVFRGDSNPVEFNSRRQADIGFPIPPGGRRPDPSLNDALNREIREICRRQGNCPKQLSQ